LPVVRGNSPAVQAPPLRNDVELELRRRTGRELGLAVRGRAPYPQVIFPRQPVDGNVAQIGIASCRPLQRQLEDTRVETTKAINSQFTLQS
jgi:hypothetical protein